MYLEKRAYAYLKKPLPSSYAHSIGSPSSTALDELCYASIRSGAVLSTTRSHLFLLPYLLHRAHVPDGAKSQEAAAMKCNVGCLNAKRMGEGTTLTLQIVGRSIRHRSALF